MIDRTAKYYISDGMDKREIEMAHCDGLVVETSDGVEVELTFRKSDGEISLSINGTMKIIPYAANVVRIDRERK